MCDLLDLLGDSGLNQQSGLAAPALVPGTANTAGGELLDLLGGLELEPTPAAPGLIHTRAHTHTCFFCVGVEPTGCVWATAAAALPVYDKDGVTLTMSCDKQSEAGLTVTLTASNSTEADISSFMLQAAVPKVPFCAHTHTHTQWRAEGYCFEWFSGVLLLSLSCGVLICPGDLGSLPQSVQLHMRAPSGDVLPARGAAAVSQMVVLNNPNKVGGGS